jgi:tungstate transport system substrate-binding protein
LNLNFKNTKGGVSMSIINRLIITACLLALLPLGVAASEAQTIRLATTTSTDNSGLLAELLPPFEAESGYKVHVIAVGTGKALRLAREGDVDIVLVHARSAEDALVDDGFGVNRRDVMYNDFVIVGPADDPAEIKGTSQASAALAKIASSEAIFLSRGDDSGTHKREKQLWQMAGVDPAGDWYREAGQGMGKVLQMSSELNAYTLTDRGTWLAYQKKLPLKILVEGDENLFNPYGIIAVNPAVYPDLNYTGAMQLIAWVTSPQGQKLIGNFKLQGEPLFIPSAIPLD